MREIDRRIEYLSKRLDLVEVVEPPRDTEKVRFLSRVRVSDDNGVERAFVIVGADETNTSTGAISWRSPVAKALIGRSVDDEVTVETPVGLVTYVVESIESAADGNATKNS